MTIKTQNGKVITKDGKVSCECCECCLYPAQALADGLYAVDDLPDSVLLSYDFADELECTRSGNIYTGILHPSLTYTVYLGELEGNPTWLLGINGSPDDDFPCLINRPYPRVEGEGTVEDQFADTYTVSGPISGTVTRESICVWSGENLRVTNFGYQWRINGNSKSGDQNTPVGSYAGGFSVS
jgi:hypothetical protein